MTDREKAEAQRRRIIDGLRRLLVAVRTVKRRDRIRRAMNVKGN